SRPGPPRAPRPPSDLVASWTSPRRGPPPLTPHRRHPADDSRSAGPRRDPSQAAVTTIPPDHPGWVRRPGPPDMTIPAWANPGLRQAFTTAPDELGTAGTHVTAPIGGKRHGDEEEGQARAAPRGGPGAA